MENFSHVMQNLSSLSFRGARPTEGGRSDEQSLFALSEAGSSLREKEPKEFSPAFEWLVSGIHSKGDSSWDFWSE